MNYKVDVEKAITEFGTCLETIISRLGYDKYIEGEILYEVCGELSKLDLYLEKPYWDFLDVVKPTLVINFGNHHNEVLCPSLYGESMTKIKKYEKEIEKMYLVTEKEKERIKSCCKVLTETSRSYFLSQALFPDF